MGKPWLRMRTAPALRSAGSQSRVLEPKGGTGSLQSPECRSCKVGETGGGRPARRLTNSGECISPDSGRRAVN